MFVALLGALGAFSPGCLPDEGCTFGCLSGVTWTVAVPPDWTWDDIREGRIHACHNSVCDEGALTRLLPMLTTTPSSGPASTLIVNGETTGHTLEVDQYDDAEGRRLTVWYGSQRAGEGDLYEIEITTPRGTLAVTDVAQNLMELSPPPGECGDTCYVGPIGD